MEDRGLDIQASTLGKKARYGLFATVPFKKDEIIDVLTGNSDSHSPTDLHSCSKHSFEIWQFLCSGAQSPLC